MLIDNTRTRKNASSFIFFAGISAFLLATALIIQQFIPESFENTSEANNFSEYRSETNRFSISYPATWRLVPGNEKAGVTTISSYVESSTQNSGLINPISFQTPPSLALNHFNKIDVLHYDVAAGTSPMAFLTSRSNAGIVGKSREILVAGVVAIRLDLDMSETTTAHVLSRTYTSVYLTRETDGYIIAGFASPEILDRIIKSFQIW